MNQPSILWYHPGVRGLTHSHIYIYTYRGRSWMGTLILQSFGINGFIYVHQLRSCIFLQGI